jgi:putative transposase
MNTELPPSPSSFALKPVPTKDLKADLPPKDWPHAPVHRLSEYGLYFVTAGTLHKQHLFNTPPQRDLFERMLLSLAKARGWQLEAWAVFANHYHFVARGCPDSKPMGEFLRELHSRSAIELNKLAGIAGRTVWYNFRDTRLTYQYSSRG